MRVMESSSFRDPSGYVFVEDGILYRQVNSCYAADYSLLISSGLYDDLVKEGLLIKHEEVEDGLLRPDLVCFISYPYEWSFSMLKDAALAILEIQRRSMAHGMVLKDASAYNIQFVNGRPTLIDTLSFMQYQSGEPWGAYRQFCQHFLNPLALMAYKDIRLGQLLRIYLDGIPPDLTNRLMPSRAWLRPSLLNHIRLHSAGEGKVTKRRGPKMPKIALEAFVDNLTATITKLKWHPKGGWAEYKKAMNYSDDSFAHKKALVATCLNKIQPKTVWDLGSNTGEFSAIAHAAGAEVVSFDMDPACTELHYLKKRGGLPLIMDLSNPSSSIGWANAERRSLVDRGPVGLVLALALVHHLAITNNVPLDRIADFLADLCRHLIIEFVPKEDSQVQKLLSSREDIFHNYDSDGFRQAFSKHFTIHEEHKVQGTYRTIYWMEAQP